MASPDAEARLGRSASDVGAGPLRAVWVSRDPSFSVGSAAAFNPLPFGAAPMRSGYGSAPAPPQWARTFSDSRLYPRSGAASPTPVAPVAQPEPVPAAATPTIAGIAWRNWRNWLPVGGLAVEAAQLVAIAFLTAWQADGLGMAWVWRRLPQLLLFARRGVGDPPTGLDDALAVVAMVVVAAYVLLVGWFAAGGRSPSHPLGPLVYEFLPGDLYLTLTSRLLHCAVAHSGLALLLQGASRAEAEAFVGEHGSVAMVSLALACLAFYTSSAIFISTYRKDTRASAADVVTLPVFRVVERSLKSLLAFSTVLCLGAPTAQLVVATALTLALTLAVAKLRPMWPRVLDTARLCTLGACLWTIGLALASVAAPHSDAPWVAAVAAGWGLATLVFALSTLRSRLAKYAKRVGPQEIGP